MLGRLVWDCRCTKPAAHNAIRLKFVQQEAKTRNTPLSTFRSCRQSGPSKKMRRLPSALPLTALRRARSGERGASVVKLTADAPRAASTAAATSAPTTTDGTIEYTGPLSTTVTRLKRVSLLSCALTTASAPALATLDAVGGAHPAAQAGIAAAVASFGVFTTGLLHWFTSPYVHRLSVAPAAPDVAVVETRDVLARRRVEQLALSTLAPPTGTLHPQATFRANGRLYYVDTDNFPVDTALARAVCGRLVAVKAAADGG